MAKLKRQLTLALHEGPGTDPEELAHLTGQLRRRLLELEVDSVDLARSCEAPPGAKLGDAVTIGALVVTAAPMVLRAVVGLVETWLSNRPLRGVTFTIDDDALELTNASRTEQRHLVQAFIDRHAGQ
jgi:hypothetical protein